MRELWVPLALAGAMACGAPSSKHGKEMEGGLPVGDVVDLSHAYDEKTLYWPTDRDGFVLEKLAEGRTELGYWYAANRFRSAEHGGTHIDAPIHFAEGKLTVDAIPLERLMGAAVVIDVSDACARDPDHRVTSSDLEAFEDRHGRIPAGAIVLLRTGWGARWPDRGRYLGTEKLGPEAIAELHFPGLHPDAARWLTENRQIAAIGLDTPSIDYGQSTRFESHQVLFAHDIPAFENLANLDRLPATGATVIALPMKIAGGSGGPLRAVAIVP